MDSVSPCEQQPSLFTTNDCALFFQKLSGLPSDTKIIECRGLILCSIKLKYGEGPIMGLDHVTTEIGRTQKEGETFATFVEQMAERLSSEYIFKYFQNTYSEVDEKGLAVKCEIWVERFLGKHLTIKYTLPENPQANFSLCFEKNYDHQCASCRKIQTLAHKLFKCSKCLSTYYCNSECQRNDWKAHQVFCLSKT